MDFAKAYRACKRTQALPRGLRSVEACLERDGKTQEEKMRLGNSMLMEMYPPDGLAELIYGVWSARKTFEQFHSQLVESAKAYCLGLYSVAIVGLLPCVEGIVRRLGVLSGI